MAIADRLTLSVQFPLIAAGTDEVLYATIAAEGTFLLKSAYVVPWTNRTAHDTNYTDLSIELGTTEVASLQTTTGGSGNLVAGTPIALTLSNVIEVAQGSKIAIKKTDAGSGLAFDGGFDLYFERIRV